MSRLDEVVMLPITIDELDKMSDEIFKLAELPDQPSYRHAIASAIMHLDPITDRKELAFFAKAIRKAISNQVAFNKMKQLEKEDNEKQAATPGTESNESGIQAP